ncbi:MAG: hypothetical protein IPN34_20215 [Planctomycetes bacterium]|nr:hypothetical protein [Planctomycetota bacterium]
MRTSLRRSLLFALFAAASSPLAAQQTVTLLADSGGTGADGAFVATAGAVLDSAVKPVWNFTSFTVPAGIVVEMRGALPLEIRVQGIVRIDGIVDASGRPGADAANDAPGGAGGRGGPGGGAGGAGGASAAQPFAGAGQRGQLNGGLGGLDTGVPGGSFTDPVGGGGGGANGVSGQAGGPANSGRTPSGSGAGALAAARCFGGGGGGGGAGDIDSLTVAALNDGGGAGGGGGGRISFVSPLVIQIGAGARLHAVGGNGGASFGNGGGGGGGAGGFVTLVAPFVVVDGEILASPGLGGAATQILAGASPGGRGGAGCVHLSGTITGTGFVFPTPAISSYELEVGARSDPQGIDVLLGDPMGSFVTGLAVSRLGTPIALPGIGELWLDPTDFLFTVTIGQPAFGSSFTGLTGGATGRIVIAPPRLDPSTAALDLVLYLQVFAFDAQVRWNGLSLPVPIHFLF